jgi:hypothetical protein
MIALAIPHRGQIVTYKFRLNTAGVADALKFG